MVKQSLTGVGTPAVIVFYTWGSKRKFLLKTSATGDIIFTHFGLSGPADLEIGLYFAGEAIEIAGPESGYNLQKAFSTGWLAGKSI